MKNLLIFLITFILVIGIGLILNEAFALTLGGVDLGDNLPVTRDVLSKGHIIIYEDDDNYYLGLTSRLGADNVYIYASTIDAYYGGSRSVYDFYKINKVTKDCVVFSNTASFLKKLPVLLSDLDVKYNNTTLDFSKNFYREQILKHGDKYSIYNDSNTVLNSTYEFTLNKLSNGVVFLTDEDGNFLEQVTFGLETGLKVPVFLPPKKTTNIYVAFTAENIFDSNMTIDVVKNPLTFTGYTPSYKIVGGSTVSLNGLDIPNTIPYLISNATTDIFYQYKKNNITYTKMARLLPNVKFTLDSNTRYLIKFRHDNMTTISVQSNIALGNTSERISLLDDDALKEELINNGGSIEESSNPAKFVEVNRTKVLKVTSKRTGIFTKVMTISVQGSNNSNALISRYGIQADIPGSLIKLGEYKQTGNQGKYNVVIPNDNGYVVVEESSGLTAVTIDGKYKEGTDYTIEFINKSEYTKDENVENDYRESNPDSTPIDRGDGYVNKEGDNIFDNIWNGWNNGEGSGSSLPDIDKLSSTVTEFTSVFLTPMTTFFKGLPEMYSLILFGLGTGIVLMILGR